MSHILKDFFCLSGFWITSFKITIDTSRNCPALRFLKLSLHFIAVQFTINQVVRGLSSKIIYKQQIGGMRDKMILGLKYPRGVYWRETISMFSTSHTSASRYFFKTILHDPSQNPKFQFPDCSWSLHFIWVTHAHSQNCRAHPGSNQKWQYMPWCHPLCKWGLGQPHMHNETVSRALLNWLRFQ